MSNERKDDIRAARANVIIVRYMMIIILALAFLGAALYTSYYLLHTTMDSANARIAGNDVKADVYGQTKKQVDALSAKLSDAKSILNQEVRYSQALVKIGQLMPPGTVLASLTLTTANFNGTPLDITAYAKSTTEASALQAKFQTSPLFSQVNLKGTSADKGIDGYPVSISMTVLLNRAGL